MNTVPRRRCSMKGCKAQYHARGLCSTHYTQLRKSAKFVARKKLTLKERFWSHVDKNGPIHPILAERCWVWTSTRKEVVSGFVYGYTRLYSDGKRTFVLAHRLSYELACGPIPKGLFVCHKCDNPLCVRPDHLWLGTPKDNVTDMRLKGRAHITRGEMSAQHKLTDAAVREIRRLAATGHYTQKALGDRFGVSGTLIGHVVNRKKWRHVKD